MTSAKVCGNCIAGVKPCLGTPCALATIPTTDAREREHRDADNRVEEAKRQLRAAIRHHRTAVDADTAMRRVMKCEAELLHAAKALGQTQGAATERARVRAVVEGIVPTLVVDWNTATGRECLPREEVLARLDAEPTP